MQYIHIIEIIAIYQNIFTQVSRQSLDCPDAIT